MKFEPGKTILTDIQSSNVQSMEYNAPTQELKVKLKTGTYLYKDVPQRVFDILELAYLQGQSVGQAFNKQVVKGGYTYEKL